MSLLIELPWPPKPLWPNSHLHWSKKLRHTRQAKIDGRLATMAALQAANPYPPADLTARPVMVRLIFHPPDRRRRDRDNMQAAMKHYLDGIAAALEVDDSIFAPYSLVGDPDTGRGTVMAEVG